MSQASPAPTLRLASERDAAEIQAIYAPYVRDTCISFELDPPDVGEIGRRIAAVLPRWPWLVSERDGKIVGYAYASEHRVRAAFRWAVDVAIYVGEGEHRTGVGRALYSALLDLLRLQGFCHAYAGIYLPNPASVGLHEAMGFRPIAVFEQVGYKQGEWRDVGWWHLALRELPAKPLEPLRSDIVRGHPEWNAILHRGKAGLG